MERLTWPRPRGVRLAGRVWFDCGVVIHERSHHGFEALAVSGHAGCLAAQAVFIELIHMVQREARDPRLDCSAGYCSETKTGSPLVTHVRGYRCDVADFHDAFAAQWLVICRDGDRYVMADAHGDGEPQPLRRTKPSGMAALAPAPDG